MRRVLIAAGLLTVLGSALACWPLARLWLTYEHGHARVLELYRTPGPDRSVSLHAVWQLEIEPGRLLLCDAQRDRFFRPMPDPVVDAAEADEIAQRLLPDRQNRQTLVRAFWQANDPGGSAFIIDVSQTHPWRRYIVGLAVCTAGLICIRIGWAMRPDRRTTV